MLEWLDVSGDKGLMYQYSIEALNSDKNAVSRALPVAALNRRPTLVSLELLLPEFQARLVQ